MLSIAKALNMMFLAPWSLPDYSPEPGQLSTYQVEHSVPEFI